MLSDDGQFVNMIEQCSPWSEIVLAELHVGNDCRWHRVGVSSQPCKLECNMNQVSSIANRESLYFWNAQYLLLVAVNKIYRHFIITPGRDMMTCSNELNIEVP